MKSSLGTSLALHALALGWAMVSLSAPASFEVADVEALPVDIVPIEELTQIQQGDDKAPVAETAAPKPTSRPDKVENAENVGDNSVDLKAPPLPVSKPVQTEAAAAPKPAEKPTPKPVPQPNEVKDIVPEETAPKPTEVAALPLPKPEIAPPQPAPKPAVTPAKPQPAPKPEAAPAKPQPAPQPEMAAPPKSEAPAKPAPAPAKPAPAPAETASDAPPLPDRVPVPAARPAPPRPAAETAKAGEAAKPTETASAAATAKAADTAKAAEAPSDRKDGKRQDSARSSSSKQSDFNADEIASLLNKQQASGGGAKRSTAPAARGGKKNTGGSKLSQSEVDALRGQIQDNWSVIAGIEGADGVIITVTMRLDESGAIVGRPQVSARGGSPNARRTLEGSALRAVMRSSPFRNLPPDKYDAWNEVVVNFDPSELL